MQKTASVLLLISISVLQACSYIPPASYSGRGDPESLLDVSSEIVNLSVHDRPAVAELTSWIDQDQPSRAELYCPEGAESCEHVMDVLDLYGVPYASYNSNEYMIALVYERVLARDCTNRYIDNTVNPYHLNHPTFGCSLAVNMAQMVTDKKQFVRPNLMDPMSARKAVQAYRNYLEPPRLPENEGASDSLLEEAQTQ